ncbi:MAG: uncharacterized protein QOD05_2277 [Microbacteriaceae bacterium]|jgi:uncharacterized Tic20 family protein|nr:uncharacterized protein [Microbacteriaceae bacterium]
MSDATPPPPPANPYQGSAPLSPADEKLWATLIHIGGIFFGFLPALIGYLVLKDKGPFIHMHTATALNFQISLAIYTAAIFVITIFTFGFGAFLFFPLGVVALIFMIIAAIKANQGQPYAYPLTIKFVS